MLQPIWAMIKPFGFVVLWIWHPSEVSALGGQFDAAFSLINSGGTHEPSRFSSGFAADTVMLEPVARVAFEWRQGRG